MYKKYIFPIIYLLSIFIIDNNVLAKEINSVDIQKQFNIFLLKDNNQTIINKIFFETIYSDLYKTNQFKIINNFQEKDYKNSEKIYFLEYSLSLNPIDNKYNIDFYLTESSNKKLIDNATFISDEQEIRSAAHSISNRVYEKITGINGIFSSKIAYILKKNNTYELQISDYDGENRYVALRSKDPISSPKWSHDGKKISYISFEKNKASVFIHTLLTGKRIEIAKFDDAISSPVWSHDGKNLILSIMKNNNPQICIINIENLYIKQITNSYSINTEPIFFNNSNSIIFTSDRSGNPQIYKTSISNNDFAKRITFNGEYNVSPNISHDNTSLVFVSKENNNFCIKNINLLTQRETILSNGPNDSYPNFSPNDMCILYSSVKDNKYVLNFISRNGSKLQELEIPGCKILEGIWGPNKK
ncbi:Protein TolB [Candidatus Kinetoplastibacterium sorsogonicusi]|uniref:Protein TolB n=1 Tax=Candidatus Kinetoplastidibacterium kentomonadis TaxID=1576550 RepID=A0A3S7JAG3_9PROT|nr:PD40 domain-containing protein [Candidatus Kinetoplastibacterium sorsogonicusi]AWD32670.1 Protein TolB [Candidatus Kinetoplastibacterium sorsogonicusi]